MSGGWKWFLGIFAVAWILMGIGFMIQPHFWPQRDETPGSSAATVALGAAVVIFGIFTLKATKKNQVEIYPDRIRYLWFTSRQLPLDEIKGFKILPTQYIRTMLLVPKSPAHKKLKFPLCIERRQEFLDWANSTLVNLDAENYRNELAVIYKSQGAGPEEAAARYTLARKWTRALTAVALGISIWAWIWPEPYRILIWSLVVFPAAGLFVLYSFNGIVKLDGDTKGAHPLVATAIILPSALLALRAMLDWHVLKWVNLWTPLSLFTAVLFIPILALAPELRRKVFNAILFLLFCAIYGFGAAVDLNGIMDTSVSTPYSATILVKHAATGKERFYYLKLSPWGPRSESEDVDVRRSVYDKYAAGETVTVYVKQGKFAIPYYFVK